ncbi:MAG: pentapeptide repeat-containing protein, partial [Cyanobacteria bacterium J06643_13]
MLEITKLLEEYRLGNRDFAGSELNGVCLYRANLTDINLQNASLIGANLSGANLTGANLVGAN